jgi:hypothetical protein
MTSEDGVAVAAAPHSGHESPRLHEEAEEVTAGRKTPGGEFELWSGHAPKLPSHRRPGHTGPQRSTRWGPHFSHAFGMVEITFP